MLALVYWPWPRIPFETARGGSEGGGGAALWEKGRCHNGWLVILGKRFPVFLGRRPSPAKPGFFAGGNGIGLKLGVPLHARFFLRIELVRW